MNETVGRISCCVALFFALFCCNSLAIECGSPPKSGRFISYVIEPKPSDDSLSLDVTVRFRVGGARTIDLVLPSEWEGQKDLYRAIRDLEVVSPGSTLEPTTDPSSRRLRATAGQIVVLHYRVVKDWSGKLDASSYFRVLLDPAYFQVAGRNFAVYPDMPEDEELPINVEWKNLPEGWNVVDNLAGESLCQTVTTKLIKLTNGLFAGGELRVTKINVEGNPVFVATRGGWQFSDDSFSSLVQKILAAERQFWHDTAFPSYLITLLPSEGDEGTYGAAALEDSFTWLTDKSTTLDFESKFLLAHEMFHCWNAARLGEIHEQKPFWFVEGFSDYYGRLLLRNAGLIDPQEYQRNIESSYAEYKRSGRLHAGGREVESKFFQDADLREMAYLRGNFLAIEWDYAIRRRSGNKQSLDDAMLSLFQQARRKELVLTDDFLGRHFSSYVGPEAVGDVQKYIEHGETIPRPVFPADPANER